MLLPYIISCDTKSCEDCASKETPIVNHENTLYMSPVYFYRLLLLTLNNTRMTVITKRGEQYSGAPIVYCLILYSISHRYCPIQLVSLEDLIPSIHKLKIIPDFFVLNKDKIILCRAPEGKFNIKYLGQSQFSKHTQELCVNSSKWGRSLGPQIPEQIECWGFTNS